MVGLTIICYYPCEFSLIMLFRMCSDFDVFCNFSHSYRLIRLFSRSLQRALDRRLYLLLYGRPYGAADTKPTWHFPEKVYDNEETLRKVIYAFFHLLKVE